MKEVVAKQFDVEERKCGGCNWETTTLYSIEGNQGEDWENGLCANCFMEWIVEEEAKVNFEK